MRKIYHETDLTWTDLGEWDRERTPKAHSLCHHVSKLQAFMIFHNIWHKTKVNKSGFTDHLNITHPPVVFAAKSLSLSKTSCTCTRRDCPHVNVLGLCVFFCWGTTAKTTAHWLDDFDRLIYFYFFGLGLEGPTPHWNVLSIFFLVKCFVNLYKLLILTFYFIPKHSH